MPRTLWKESDRADLLARVGKLRPEITPAWGKMNATQMVTHLTEWMRLATGELVAAPRNKPMRYPVMKQLVIYVLPWPKGVPTAPELLSRAPSVWNGEVEALERTLDRFASRPASDPWPAHPTFGTLSPRAWGVLAYRHF